MSRLVVFLVLASIANQGVVVEAHAETSPRPSRGTPWDADDDHHTCVVPPPLDCRVPLIDGMIVAVTPVGDDRRREGESEAGHSKSSGKLLRVVETLEVEVPAWVSGPLHLLLQNGVGDGDDYSLVHSYSIAVAGGDTAVVTSKEVAKANKCSDKDELMSFPLDIGPRDPGESMLLQLEVTLRGKDGAALSLSLCGAAFGDDTAPSIEFVAPAGHHVFVSDGDAPEFVVAFADDGGGGSPPHSGVDLSSFHTEVDDGAAIDVTARFVVTEDRAMGTLGADAVGMLADGVHTLVATVRDRVGLEGVARKPFLLDRVPPLVQAVVVG